jgi:hypothetical protein
MPVDVRWVARLNTSVGCVSARQGCFAFGVGIATPGAIKDLIKSTAKGEEADGDECLHEGVPKPLLLLAQQVRTLQRALAANSS